MIFYKTDEEIELIRESCLIVSKTLALVASEIRPGISGAELDRKAEEFIRDQQAEPGFKGYNGFPATLCISVNEGVVHGIPSKESFKEGDIVSVDCGAFKNGFFGDSAYTFALGDVPAEVENLLIVTNDSLYKGIDEIKVGGWIGNIGFAVQEYAEKEHKYGVVRQLVGHGIGKDLHEAPEVPNYGRRNSGKKMKPGLVIAIEPMVNLGTRKVTMAKDGWTIITQDNKVSAHFEHTVAVRKDGPDILTDHSLIENAIKNTSNVKEITIKS